ncbi:MAG TPA: HlyD family efflux transporter periplasmic adaptor subunit [Puia sp.]|jgi:multidrug efflux pump subunit AcrA (membrane-fusion protein)|nr:HlyD family efflux transporter periplasmic adaptor subunit [Puia sp.]
MKFYLLLLLPLLFSATGCRHPNEVKPHHQEIVDAVFGSGHIENKNQYGVVSNSAGYIKEVLVAEGDTVKKGQVLYRLESVLQQTQEKNALDNLKFARTNNTPTSPQIQQLKLQIVQAGYKAHIDSLTYARYQRLVTTHAVSTSDMENAGVQYTASASNLSVLEKNLADLEHNLMLNLQNAQAQYEIQHQNKNYYDITAKADGIIFTLVKKEGDYIRIGDQIAEVGAGSPIIKLYIAEDDIRRIREGQTVLVSLNSNKETVYSATVTKIYPAFDDTQQAFTVEARFQQIPPVLINGTQLQGNVILEDKKDALVIPSYYLMAGDKVMIKHSKEKTAVKAGIRTLEWTEIVGGITENDILVQPKNN